MIFNKDSGGGHLNYSVMASRLNLHRCLQMFNANQYLNNRDTCGTTDTSGQWFHSYQDSNISIISDSTRTDQRNYNCHIACTLFLQLRQHQVHLQ